MTSDRPDSHGSKEPESPDTSPASPDDATRVGMPVPPLPAGRQPPGQPPGQPPAYGAQQPTYGAQRPAGDQPPPPPGYGYPPPDYGYPPPPSRGGPSGILLGLLAVGLLVVIALAAIFLLDLGPFDSPSPTPAAIGTPTPMTETPTPEPVGPTPELTPTPGVATPTPQPATPTPDVVTPAPDDSLARLREHVPPDLRDSCLGLPATDALASTTCMANGGTMAVTYFLFTDDSLMQQAYDAYVLQAGIERDSGSCQTEATWPAEGVYTIDDEPAGRMLCMLLNEEPIIYWTDDEINVLSHASGQAGQAGRLFEFWQREAGPLR